MKIAIIFEIPDAVLVTEGQTPEQVFRSLEELKQEINETTPSGMICTLQVMEPFGFSSFLKVGDKIS